MGELSVERRVAEITADIQLNLRNATLSVIQIGRDLIEAKAMLSHGEWLPWLKSMEMSAATAENYMLYARQVPEGSWLADIPYSKALALLRLPEGEREQFVKENDVENKSAAEIKRLIAEAKKASEGEAAALIRAKAAEKNAEKLKKELENRKPEVIRETIEPADYQPLKAQVENLRRRVTEAEDAACEAEERANQAMADAERLRMEAADREDAPEDRDTFVEFRSICNEFTSKTWQIPFMEAEFRETSCTERRGCRLVTEGILTWAQRVLDAIDRAEAPIVLSEVS